MELATQVLAQAETGNGSHRTSTADRRAHP
jgi:hypothetical protein